MKIILPILVLLFAFPAAAQKLPPVPTGKEWMHPLSYGAESGVVKIPRHWWDFHKNRDGQVTVKLHANLRSPLYRVFDITKPGSSFLVVDPSYAYADHFTIKGPKGHKFTWWVAGRPG